jgi:hypothetical protein
VSIDAGRIVVTRTPDVACRSSSRSPSYRALTPDLAMQYGIRCRDAVFDSVATARGAPADLRLAAHTPVLVSIIGQ